MIEPIDINTPALLVSSPCSTLGLWHPKLTQEACGEVSASPSELQCRPGFQRKCFPPCNLCPPALPGLSRGQLCLFVFGNYNALQQLLDQIPEKLLMLPSRFLVPGR